MKEHALIRLLIVTNVALLLLAAAPKKPTVLSVSELDIVDSKGVVRARLAGNLPETYANGKPIGRGAAGMLLYDASGRLARVVRGGESLEAALAEVAPSPVANPAAP